MEDDLNFFEKARPQKKMQPKTITSKNNGCGTAPGNLVIQIIIQLQIKKRLYVLVNYKVKSCVMLEEIG
jgi:hypothetical protein